MMRNKKPILTCRYSQEAYPTYDNYPAIEVSKTAEIPVDFMGLMGVPITAIDMPGLQTAFEIVGLSCLNEQFTPGLPGGRLKLRGRDVFKRLLIRRKVMTPTSMWMESAAMTEAELSTENDQNDDK